MDGLDRLVCVCCVRAWRTSWASARLLWFASVARFFSLRRNATSITHSLRSMIRFRHSTQIVPAITSRSVSMWTHATRPLDSKQQIMQSPPASKAFACATAGTPLETRRWPMDASYHPHALPRRVPVTLPPGTSGLFECLVYCGKFMRHTRA